ncbi:SPOR domain-containing protein [Pseudothauera nasutitermitis]|uniref:SPOR domain-containing protein n=1 Tax=Pseudothauera nasutitermitis TaxID=2565930 RepID=A0A4V3WCE6_9RHOO|nr:SPOR domain-containing protein [Pseudothauera nasutitermitis]THF66864.1 SPOR domain-containing protein [Pseudothauera nasutitermitis]
MTDTDNVELKKRSRRRLVGAAALALLAAIILPMVMDQEPGPSGQDIQITIPDRDAELSRPIAGRAPLNVEPDVAPPPQEQPPAPPAAPAPQTAPPESRPPATPAAPPAAQPQQPAPPAQTKPPSQPAAAPQQPAPATRPPAQPPQDEAARVRAILEGQTPPPAAPAAANGFVVQIAAFGESARAEALAAELKGKGFAAYTERAGTVTRVRVGPFGNRAEADRAAERLKTLGQNPVVTAR